MAWIWSALEAWILGAYFLDAGTVLGGYGYYSRWAWMVEVGPGEQAYEG